MSSEDDTLSRPLPMRPLLVSLLLLAPAALPAPGHAQILADTVFTWQGYGQPGRCRVRVYATPPGEERTHTVVIQELAENAGPSTLDDAALLAELVGRHFGVAPPDAFWVFHWGAFSFDSSFDGARADRRKELFLRATFRRTERGALGAPSWRVVTREEVETATDRLFS